MGEFFWMNKVKMQFFCLAFNNLYFIRSDGPEYPTRKILYTDLHITHFENIFVTKRHDALKDDNIGTVHLLLFLQPGMCCKIVHWNLCTLPFFEFLEYRVCEIPFEGVRMVEVVLPT